MARFLLLLSWLLISLTKANNVQANCYAASWSNGQPVYGSLFVSGSTTLAQCQALACQIYPSISPSCPQPCVQVSETQTQSCPANFSGQITQTRIKTCPDNQWQAWTTTQNTCVANPPTCQIQTKHKLFNARPVIRGALPRLVPRCAQTRTGAQRGNLG